MGIITPPIKLNVGCATHGNNFYEDHTCKACIFLSSIFADIRKLQLEMDKITKELEEQFKAGNIVVQNVGGSFFFRGVL